MKRKSAVFSTVLCLWLMSLTANADPIGDFAVELTTRNKPVVVGLSVPTETGRDFTVMRTKFPDVVAVDPLIDIGSLTKFVTAVCILRLVDEGEFSVRTTLSEFFEGLPSDKAKITIHQLLTHTSGLFASAGPDSEFLTRAELLLEAFETPLVHAPGERYLYSNVGYSVLAAVIEENSGLPFEVFLQSELLTPNSLPQIGYTRIYRDEDSLTSAKGFLSGFRNATILETSWAGREPGWNLIGNGGLVTTAEGFLRFWEAFYSKGLISPEMREAALTPHVDEGFGDSFYGYGLVVEPSNEHGIMYWHSGGGGIFSAEWRHLKNSDVTLFTAAQRNYAFRAMSEWLDQIE